MYVLVYSSNGIVGNDDSGVMVYPTFDEAQEAMTWAVDLWIENNHPHEGYDDFYISKDHAACDCSKSSGPEYHIYKCDNESID